MLKSCQLVESENYCEEKGIYYISLEPCLQDLYMVAREDFNNRALRTSFHFPLSGELSRTGEKINLK